MTEAGSDVQERQPRAPRMGPRAAGAMAAMGMTQAARLVMTLVSTVVVARLLRPSDYGVVAMVAPITAFVLFFQDLGLSAATIQAGTITPAQSNSLFWRTMMASAAIALGLLVLSPVVGCFYGDIRAAYVSAASAVSILLVGLSLQQAALMTRDLRFAALSVIDIASAGAGLLSTVALAVWLRNYWALFAGALLAVATRTLLIWLRSGWRPSRPTLAHNVGGLVQFGRHVMGFNLINFVVRNADNILIARFAGAGALGLYDRSYKLMMFPIQTINQPINRLMLPILSRLVDEPERYRRSFLLSATAVCWLALPGIILATVFSDVLVVMLLGQRWAAAGPVFLWLGLTGVLQTVPNLTGSLFLSTGNTRVMLGWSLFSAVVTLAGFVVGLRWGAVGVAASLFVTTLARTPILFAVCRRGTSIRAVDLYAVSAGPMAGATLAALGTRYATEGLVTPVRLLIGLFAVYGLASLVSLATTGGAKLRSRPSGLVGR